MRVLTVAMLALFWLAGGGALAESISRCKAHPATITVTASNVVTQTVFATPVPLYGERIATTLPYQSAVSVDMEAFSANLDVAPTNPTPAFISGSETNATGVTGTSTVYYTYTRTVQVESSVPSSEVYVEEHPTQSSTATFKGQSKVFYYIAANGTTSWINGATPVSSGVGVTTSSTTIVVSPLPITSAATPTNMQSSTEADETTHTTLTLTRTISNVHTRTLPLAGSNHDMNAPPSMSPTAATTFTSNRLPLSGDKLHMNLTVNSSITTSASFHAAPSSTEHQISSMAAPSSTVASSGSVPAAQNQSSLEVPESSSLKHSNKSAAMQPVSSGLSSDIGVSPSTTTVTSTLNAYGVFWPPFPVSTQSLNDPVDGASSAKMVASVSPSNGDDVGYSFSLATAASSTHTEASDPALTASAYLNRYMSRMAARNARRQLGATVVATINGKVVTWTNNWDGKQAVAPTSATSTLMLEGSYGVFQPGNSSPSANSIETSSHVSSPALSSSVLASSASTTLSSHVKEPDVSTSLALTSSTDTASTVTSVAEVEMVSSSTPKTIPSPTSITPVASSASVNSTVKSAGSVFSGNGTTTASSPLPTLTGCGEHGSFTLDFDDLPIFAPDDNNTASYPPIFNPYHHFFWSDNWAYVPPPTEPFPPRSPPHLAAFIPMTPQSVNATNSPSAGVIVPGGFGAGPRAFDSAYWFNMSSLYLGCDNDGPTGCQFTITGMRWLDDTEAEKSASSVTHSIPPCPGYKNCSLTRIDLGGPTWAGLSSVSFEANVDGKEVIFWVDDLEMGWYNNTCAAGLKRQGAR